MRDKKPNQFFRLPVLITFFLVAKIYSTVLMAKKTEQILSLFNSATSFKHSKFFLFILLQMQAGALNFIIFFQCQRKIEEDCYFL